MPELLMGGRYLSLVSVCRSRLSKEVNICAISYSLLLLPMILFGSRIWCRLFGTTNGVRVRDVTPPHMCTLKSTKRVHSTTQNSISSSLKSANVSWHT